MNAELSERTNQRVFAASAVLFAAVIASVLLSHLPLHAEGVVVLRDRQRIEGDIGTDTDHDGLIWQASGFLDPFEFPFADIKSIAWPAKEAAPVSEPFAIETNDGDLITGDITSIDNDTIRLQSRSLGDFSLPMSRLVRVTRLVENPTLVFPHLSGMKDWSSSDNSGWEEEGNELISKSPDSTLLGDLNVPDRAIFELEISWVGTPNFHLSLGCDVNASPDQSAGWSITCIGGKTLAVFREREQTADLDILSMLEDDSSIRLTAFVDQRKDEISVFATDGTLLGQLKSDSPPDEDADVLGGGTGVLLTNRDGTTKLQRLRIADWIGNESNGVPVDAPLTLLMTDSTVAGASSLELNDRASEFTIKTVDGKDQQLSLKDLAGISFQANREETTGGAGDDDAASDASNKDIANEPSRDGESESPTEKRPTPASAIATVLLHDGARFSGELKSISTQTVIVRHRSTSQEVSVDRPAIQRLLWQNAKWQQPAPDLMRLVATSASGDTIASTAPLTMIGRLQASQLDDSPGLAALSWQPRGSQTAARFEDGISAKISLPELDIETNEESSKRADTAEDANRRIRDQIEARDRAELARQAADARDEAPVAEAPEISDPSPPEPADDADKIDYRNNLFLRSGDQFACQVLGTAEQGILVKPREGDQQVVPHEQVKAVEMASNVIQHFPQDRGPKEFFNSALVPTRFLSLEKAKRQRLLTLPRLQKDSPPTHILVASNGDMLRCRMLGMNADTIRVEVRLQETVIPRERISHIIWLHPDELLSKKATKEDSDVDQTENVSEEKPTGMPADLFVGYVQAIMRQGQNRLTFRPSSLENDVVHGTHDVFGDCRVELNDVSEIVLGSQISATTRQDAYQDWVLIAAKEPLVAAAIRGDAPIPSHPLNGQRAPEVNLPLLDGDRFRLSRHRGEIVVLDFWASWCAPCMQTMPKVDEVIAEFDPKRVTLLTINVSDGDAQIRRSLKRLNIRPEVALDVDGVISERYQANAIPQLVVIDPQGQIKTVFVGGGDVVVGRLRSTIQDLLAD